MAALTSIALAAAAAISGGSALVGGINQASALRAQGDYAKSVADFNSELSDIQEKDAIDRGDKEANDISKEGNQLIGSQRASIAAQGISVDTGSAEEIQTDTRRQANMNAITRRNNARREAWGFKVQAQNYTSQGQFAQMSSNNQASASILQGGLQFASSAASAVGYGAGAGNKKGS
jgi:hypothetical protein